MVLQATFNGAEFNNGIKLLSVYIHPIKWLPIYLFNCAYNVRDPMWQ